MIRDIARETRIRDGLKFYMRRNIDLAEDTGIHTTNISNFLNNRYPSLGNKSLDKLDIWLDEQK